MLKDMLPSFCSIHWDVKQCERDLEAGAAQGKEAGFFDNSYIAQELTFLALPLVSLASNRITKPNALTQTDGEQIVISDYRVTDARVNDFNGLGFHEKVVILYHDYGDGQGDLQTANKIGAILLELGYSVSVQGAYEYGQKKPLFGISVPFTQYDFANQQIPSFAIVECGFSPAPREPSLGIGEMHIGLLLDPDLMRLSSKPIHQAASVDKLSTAATFRHKLLDGDIYLGYSTHWEMRAAFAHMAESMSRKHHRKYTVILVGNGQVNQYFLPSNPEGEIVQVHRLSHEDFKTLLLISRYALSTGECSLQEALSARTPVIYEQREHKVSFGEQLSALSTKSLCPVLVQKDVPAEHNLREIGVGWSENQ
ncbi:MAG: hypothetical protein V4534_05235 [Myxococcota bacterium]